MKNKDEKKALKKFHYFGDCDNVDQEQKNEKRSRRFVGPGLNDSLNSRTLIERKFAENEARGSCICMTNISKIYMYGIYSVEQCLKLSIYTKLCTRNNRSTLKK